MTWAGAVNRKQTSRRAIAPWSHMLRGGGGGGGRNSRRLLGRSSIFIIVRELQVVPLAVIYHGCCCSGVSQLHWLRVCAREKCSAAHRDATSSTNTAAGGAVCFVILFILPLFGIKLTQGEAVLSVCLCVSGRSPQPQPAAATSLSPPQHVTAGRGSASLKTANRRKSGGKQACTQPPTFHVWTRQLLQKHPTPALPMSSFLPHICKHSPSSARLTVHFTSRILLMR